MKVRGEGQSPAVRVQSPVVYTRWGMVTREAAALLRLSAAMEAARGSLRGVADAAEVVAATKKLDVMVTGALQRMERANQC